MKIQEQELIEKIKNYENNIEVKEKIKYAWENYKEFLKLYPFREHPENIELLKPEDIYNPGKNYFFLWIEFKLRGLGGIRIGSARVWENAKEKYEILKDLLKISVNDSLSLSEKIDAHWETIKFFGGDKIIAKKIISCYYPEKIVPIFKTEDLEHFANMLGLNFEKEVLEKYGKPYDDLTVGQKFELFNNLLLQFKNRYENLKKWDNVLFTYFLYDTFPPIKIPPRQIKPLHKIGLLFEPEYEQEVLYIFSLYHKDLGFPYIIRIRNEFPDAEVMNEKKEIKKIEFEIKASDFLMHKHDKKGCDYIVCWENDLEEEQLKNLPEVISLKDLL